MNKNEIKKHPWENKPEHLCYAMLSNSFKKAFVFVMVNIGYDNLMYNVLNQSLKLNFYVIAH